MQESITQPAGNQPTVAEVLRRALTPPEEKPALRQSPNYLLRIQLLLCAALLLFLMAARGLGWPAFSVLQSQLSTALSEGIDLSEQAELVRFASQFVEGVRVRASSWATGQAQASEQSSLSQSQQVITLASLGKTTLDKTPPEGYSEKSYLPLQDLSLPLPYFSVTSGYGWRSHPITGKSDFHTGVDLAAEEGTAISAVLPGFVLNTGRSRSYGNYVLLLHADGLVTRYCHMQYVFVRRGEEIDEGGVLGTVGSTGMTTGPHLHFELAFDDMHYDPAKALGL